MQEKIYESSSVNQTKVPVLGAQLSNVKHIYYYYYCNGEESTWTLIHAGGGLASS